MKITQNFDCGKIHLKSRIVFPPMATGSSIHGVPGERTAKHYEQIAKNPFVGLIITEHSFVDMQGRADPNQISFADDGVIAAQREMTGKIREANPEIRIFAQINHAGANTSSFVTGEELVSASNINLNENYARALSKSEIKSIEEKFALAAKRVKKSGYDGVEIHCAHGYLLNQFYSPLTNFRDDEYGAQNIENRVRFLVETITAVKNSVGDDFSLAIRLGGCDYMSGGSTVDDAAQAAKITQNAGADLIDISGGMCGFMRRDNRNYGWFSDMSERVKKAVDIPVLVTGGIKTPSQAEALIEENKTDLAGVGRSLFANPKWGKQ